LRHDTALYGVQGEGTRRTGKKITDALQHVRQV
jgi:hypothetical protein